MIDRRLLTSGCSCTQYCWPTWADYLGKHFAEFVNVGLCGADNAVIARNVMQVANAGDVVVVAWSGFDRFNSFVDDKEQSTQTVGDRLVVKWSSLDLTQSGGWVHPGSVASDKEFLVNHYHRIERFRNTLDYIKMLEMHSRLVGYELWNFSMIDLFLGESESKIDPRLQDMFSKAELQHFYLGKDLNSVRDEIAPLTLTHKYNTIGDTHPTPLPQWIWLREHVAPEIGIELDMSWENQVKLDQERVLRGDID